MSPLNDWVINPSLYTIKRHFIWRTCRRVQYIEKRTYISFRLILFYTPLVLFGLSAIFMFSNFSFHTQFFVSMGEPCWRRLVPWETFQFSEESLVCVIFCFWRRFLLILLFVFNDTRNVVPKLKHGRDCVDCLWKSYSLQAHTCYV